MCVVTNDHKQRKKSCHTFATLLLVALQSASGLVAFSSLPLHLPSVALLPLVVTLSFSGWLSIVAPPLVMPLPPIHRCLCLLLQCCLATPLLSSHIVAAFKLHLCLSLLLPLPLVPLLCLVAPISFTGWLSFVAPPLVTPPPPLRWHLPLLLHCRLAAPISP
jgi:hypothetical protein